MATRAYVKGKDLGTRGAEYPSGRQYETEKSQKEFKQGYVDGLKLRHPGQMIVQCNREGAIFAAYPVDRTKYTGRYIECPTCGRRYYENGQCTTDDLPDASGPGYYSDRKLTILYTPNIPDVPSVRKSSSPGDSHEVGGII